ncbi:MAG TPA: VOC family protein [Balneolaceae bacterium]|nr:VOC family protein [Balneolaceae bacterium]
MANEEFLGLRTVIYKVSDLGKAKSWYTLILDKPPYFDEPYYVGFEVNGYELGLLPIESNEHRSGDNVMVYWGVADIKEAYNRLLDLGAVAHEKPENVGENIWVATVRDPWRNLFGVIENPHFNVKK